jgi:hypothetical protein
VAQEIRKRPNFQWYKPAGLEMTTTHGKLRHMEEVGMARLAKYIPGVAGSIRAFSTLMNLTRADIFDAHVATLGRKGTVTPEQRKVIANFANTWTLRGSLGGAEGAAEALATTFFSPRKTVAGFQVLLGQPMWKGDARTRLAIAREYARSLVGIGVFYGVVVGLGDLLYDDDDERKPRLNLDPRQPGFLNIRIGKASIDPLAGLSQTIVLLSRLGANVYSGVKTLAGGSVDWKSKQEMKKTLTTVSRFGQSKLSPWLGSAVDLMTGVDYLGNEVTPGSLVTRTVVPLTFPDIYKSMTQMGVPAGTALSLLNIFGMRVNIYNRTLGQQAISEVYGLRNDFLESVGHPVPEPFGTSKIRAMRESVYDDDYDAFVQARKKYVAAGGNYMKFAASLRGIDPIATRLNDVDEAKFRRFLTDPQKAQLKVAQDYARELRSKLAEWWTRAATEGR